MSSRGKTTSLVRIRDFNMYNDQVSELKNLTSQIKAEKSENLSQSDIRVLEVQLSKIQDSFSKHLYTNVRVMKPLEKQFSVRETREPKDVNLEERVLNYHKKMIGIVEEINSHKKKVLDILKNNNLAHIDLGKIKEECEKLDMDFEKVQENEKTQLTAKITNEPKEFGGITWDPEEIDNQISKFAKDAQLLGTELGSVCVKLASSQSSIQLLSKNENYAVKEEEKESLRKAIKNTQPSTQLEQIISSQQTTESSQSLLSSEQNKTPKKKKKKKKAKVPSQENSIPADTVQPTENKRKDPPQQPEPATKKPKH